MKRAKRTIVILGLALASCRGPVLSPTATPQFVDLQLLATTATYPLLQELAASFARPGLQLVLDATTVGWPTVQARLAAGDVPFALTSYLPPESNLWAAPVAQDGIAIVVHPSNPLATLSFEELRLLFGGRIESWRAVGGPDVPVVVVSQEPGADTRLVFETLVMEQQPITLGARLALSSQRVVDTVADEVGGIGYVSMAYLNADVRAVAIASPQSAAQAELPTPQTVSAGAYPLRTPILMVGAAPPPPDSLYRDWFAWMQSDAGQAVVMQRYGGMPNGIE